MLRFIYFKLILFFCFIGKSLSAKANTGFTIDTEGKKVVTTQITGQNEFTAIAFTEIGSLIKYKSDTSIVSTKKFEDPDLNSYTKSFICQYSINKVVLTRDKKIFEITLNSDGDTLEKKGEANRVITNLHCNFNKYIYTYLSSDSKSYNFKVSDKTLITTTSQTNTILSSSCFLSGSSLVLCINIIDETKKLLYYYHNSGSSSILKSGEINLNNIHEIKGALIKYYDSNEILLCLSTKPSLISDIFFNCSLLSANTNTRTLTKRNTENPIFSAIEKIDGDINYCQIEKLTFNLYATICLSFYYRTNYLLSIIKYDTNNNKFIFYSQSSNNYKDISFALLKISPISIIVFEDNIFGIFYKDIDNDSMILVFYPKCGINFDYAPLENTNPISCDSINNPTTITSNTHYYDECSHSFLLKSNIQGYTAYDKNQFCKIKRIECDNANNYKKDKFVDGYYKCRKEDAEIEGYYFDSNAGEFRKCDPSCSICKGPLNELNDANCLQCNYSNGYYNFTFENPNYCLHKDEPKNHYYFDSQNQVFKECRKECLTCTEYPDDLIDVTDTNSTKDTKCTKCDDTSSSTYKYYPQVDKPSNCIEQNSNDIIYYYFNGDYKRWEKCTAGCLYCTEYGTSIYDTKCVKKGDELCDTDKGYYPVEGDTSEQKCFNKDVIYDNYYFNETENLFKKCDPSCLHCDNNVTCLPIECNVKGNYFPILLL